MLLLTLEYDINYLTCICRLWDTIEQKIKLESAEISQSELTDYVKIWAKEFNKDIYSLNHTTGFTKLN